MRYKKKKYSAFTLIEIITVMCIISLLATIAIPKINRYINQANKTKVIAAVSELNNYLISMEIENTEIKDINTVLNAYGKIKHINISNDGSFSIGKVKGTLKYNDGVITAILTGPTEFANQEISIK
ncbi:type II secretion system protein [Caviibacter abscessus]|uniref:type II secretion system protein n=1 Tax=Caviibacter abscessus TaxID=1766719 RepID=UPI00083378ED|nr:type II secretion system protein [Caviibacter abscessus]